MNFKILVAGIVIIVILYVLIGSNHSQLQPSLNSSPSSAFSSSPTPNYTKSSPNTLNASLAVLNALSSYYVASNADLTITNTSQDIVTQQMTVLLKQNQYLQDGNTNIQQYAKDPNKFISVTIEGMTVGADQIIKANNEYINFLRSANLSDPNFQQNLSYAIAKHSADQDAGFKLITVGAPQISALYYDYPKTDHPTGPIPYLLSPADRQTIINTINSLFGAELAKYPKGYDVTANNYIAILVAVYSIRNNIVPDTYEQNNPINTK